MKTLIVLLLSTATASASDAPWDCTPSGAGQKAVCHLKDHAK